MADFAVFVSHAQLRHRREVILGLFPHLREYVPDEVCPSCAVEEVRQEFGDDEATAWARLEEISFLLGEVKKA
jgi:hypothetical protein